ncbi:hypothetical protein V8C37DRAFT_135919 [Trichoderma ceciliae]
MPRKFMTQEVKDQNRESQRRSRARRNELVNDLKKQVEDFQRQGASASLELQRVAQAATFENQCLRNLLSIHGVSQDEIDGYISSPPAPPLTTQPSLYEPSALRCKACGSTSIMLEKLPSRLPARESRESLRLQQSAADHCQLLSSESSEAIQHSHATRKMANNTSTTAFASPRVRSNIKHGTGPGSHQSQEHNQAHYLTSHSNEDKTHHSDTSLEFDPPLATSHDDSHRTSDSVNHADTMETSCDTAASILVDLHHHADPERARAALGCKGPNSCTVNNIKIFQLLEKFP